MQAAMYLRKSRAEEQAPVQDTLRRHREILNAHAQAHEIAVTAVYEEVASGDSLYARPEILRLLSDLERYEAVLCMDIDRLGRGAMHEQGLILEALRAADVLIITPGKTYNPRDDLDDSLISFKALFAREEYKLIRGRLKRGIMKTVQEGGYVANAPFGYTKTRVDKRPTLAIDEREAAAVRMIFDLYNDGQGCGTIARTLNALGYKPRRAEQFGRSTIAGMLKNPVYIGKVIWNQYAYKHPKQPGAKHTRAKNGEAARILAEGRHEAIVAQPVFARANLLLSGKSHPPCRKPDELKNPLSGVLYCQNCGRAMVRRPLSGKPGRQPMLLCQTAGCCMASGQDTVEMAFYMALRALLWQLETYERAPASDETCIARTAPAAAKKEVSRLQTQLNRLYDLLEQGLYDPDTFVSRRDILRARLQAAEDILRRPQPLTGPEISVPKLATVMDAYWEGTPSERNRLIKAVVSRAVYDKPKGSAWKAPPFIRIVSWARP